jgi:hypothetical protein
MSFWLWLLRLCGAADTDSDGSSSPPTLKDRTR